MKTLLLVLLSWVLWHSVTAQTLGRRAFVGLIVSETGSQLSVDSVLPHSMGEKAGLHKKDLIQTINNVSMHSVKQYQEICNEIREQEEVVIQFVRNKSTREIRTMAIPYPRYSPDWAEVIYGEVAVNECMSRTIIYKPKGVAKAPGIFFIPGYNCSSIEGFSSNFNGKMIEGWVKNGYVVYTVEKSGMGDSRNCKACIDVDLQTDIQLFEKAYHHFAQLNCIDSNQLYIWGHSMGGIIAPLIVSGKPVSGIMVFGTVFRPWSEFLLEMHRVQKPLLESLSFEQTEDFIRLIQKIYFEFFVLKKSPAQLFQNPEYRALVETELEYKNGKEEMWGRHWRFWQQLDSINLAKAWQNVNCHVLVLHGNADFIQCSSVEPYLICEAVNSKHPGNASLVAIQGLDHLIMNSKNYPEAVKNMNEKAYLKGNFNRDLLNETVKWLQTRIGKR
jgi:alpha-beta hydrolase superfamily lysophospholipase